MTCCRAGWGEGRVHKVAKKGRSTGIQSMREHEIRQERGRGGRGERESLSE